MATTTDTIRIDDLADPVLSPEQQAAVDFAATLDIELDAGSIVAEARHRTGLDDLGDPSVVDRLRAQADAVDGDAGLTGLGRLIIRRRLVGLMAARLRLEDFLRRFPEALDIELEPPVIVVGLPRSGTTHLVNLIAADTRFRSLPWWECQEPIPVWGDGPGADGVDPRYLRCLADYEAESAVAPLTRAMHDRPPQAIEEECELLDLDVASYTIEWHARVPAWRDHYLRLDHDAHYAYLVRILKALTFLRGPRRWVLKTPQHLEQLGPLMRTFPDATIAFTMRDPVAVIQSAITMLAYGDRVRRHAVEPEQLAAYWTDRVERLLRSCVAGIDLVPAEQRVDVVFDRFMADDMAMVERIYAAAGIEMTDDARRALEAYVHENPRGKHGRVAYDLKGDFGVDPAEVRRRFDFYFQRFPDVTAEV